MASIKSKTRVPAMATASITVPRSLGLVPGLTLAMLVAAGAAWTADSPLAQRLGLTTLTLAIVFGFAIGNTSFSRLESLCGSGVDFSKTTLLRLGIILYGFRISFQEVATVGWSGVLVSALTVALIFLLALHLGTRLFKLDRETTILIGAGSAICGAAAVMAAAPLVRAPAHKVAVAVATVVVFGTLSMFLYPLIYPYLGLSEHAYGMFVGSAVHEVAQVVVAGGAVGQEAEASAVVQKMLRVMMLAPFLLLLSRHLNDRSSLKANERSRITIPWFALIFLAVIAFNSLALLPRVVVTGLIHLDTALLAMAMAALGLRTNISAVSRAGIRPMLLAAMLFAFLGFGGYALNAISRALF